MIRTVTLPNGETVPALGQGTWRMAERPAWRDQEIAALRAGVDLGLTLIDTAEMYADGGAEELVAEALGDRRDELFVVTKVYPHNASRRGVTEACERSLRRLRTDRIDLYLLHWRGGIPVGDTVAGFEDLRGAGKIRHWGVSNFDTDDMEELLRVPGGEACATNQVLYNVTRRGPEFDLLPMMAAQRIPLMAYSPVEQGKLPGGGPLQAVARKHGATRFQIALAWVLRRPDVVAIPKAGNPAHVRDNAAALAVALDDEDLKAIDRAFPPPKRRHPLEMI